MKLFSPDTNSPPPHRSEERCSDGRMAPRSGHDSTAASVLDQASTGAVIQRVPVGY